MKKFSFDIVLSAAITVEAEDERQARNLLSQTINCADTNFGAWPNGEPILGESTVEEITNLYEVDGEAV